MGTFTIVPALTKHDAVAMNTGFGDSPADGIVLMANGGNTWLPGTAAPFVRIPRMWVALKLSSRSAGNGDQVEDVAGIVTGLHGFEEDGRSSVVLPRYQWLNGKTGIVTAFNSSNGLYTVQLSDTKGTIESRKPQTFKLRRENLRSADSLIQEGYVGPSHSSKGSGSRIRSYMSPSADGAAGGLYASNAGSSAVEEDRSTDSSFQFGFDDTGLSPLSDCSSLANAGYCGYWFCPNCTHAGLCDLSCGFCETSATPIGKAGGLESVATIEFRAEVQYGTLDIGSISGLYFVEEADSGGRVRNASYAVLLDG